MTIEDYSTIHRKLGFIEGATYTLDNSLYDAVLGAISEIEQIIEKEMVGDTE